MQLICIKYPMQWQNQVSAETKAKKEKKKKTKQAKVTNRIFLAILLLFQILNSGIQTLPDTQRPLTFVTTIIKIIKCLRYQNQPYHKMKRGWQEKYEQASNNKQYSNLEIRGREATENQYRKRKCACSYHKYLV